MTLHNFSLLRYRYALRLLALWLLYGLCLAPDAVFAESPLTATQRAALTEAVEVVRAEEELVGLQVASRAFSRQPDRPRGQLSRALRQTADRRATVRNTGRF